MKSAISAYTTETSKPDSSGGGLGGSGGGGSAAAKTEQLGYLDQETEEELVPQAWEVENGLSSRADLAVALVALSVSHRRGSRFSR